MFDFRSAPDNDAAPLDTASADTGSRDATAPQTSSPVPHVDPVQFRLPGSYSMDGMTAVLPGLFPAPDSWPPRAGTPSAAGQQHQAPKKTGKRGRKGR
jgi:hypothetical protein